MAARTISELANWDGRLDQQRQNTTWRRSSSTLARDPYHTPQSIDVFHPPDRFSDQKRADQSAFRSNLEVRAFSPRPFLSLAHVKPRARQRDSLADSHANARPPSRVDTTSIPSHHYHQTSITVNLPPFPWVHSFHDLRSTPL